MRRKNKLKTSTEKVEKWLKAEIVVVLKCIKIRFIAL